MDYSFAQLLWLFFIYGFSGWCVEVVYAAARHGKFVNRGFLIGPICPIYGYGVVAVLLALTPLMDNFFFVYIGSVLICSAFELVVGWLAEKFLHTRLWDYSENALNIGGYVCLSFSLLWGVGCLCVVYIVHPAVMKLVGLICLLPHEAAVPLAVISAVFITDLIITLLNALKLDKHMRAIDDAARAIEKLSIGVGESLAGGALKAQEKGRELEELRVKYREELEKRNFVHRHLISAFPHLKNVKYSSALERIRAHRSGK